MNPGNQPENQAPQPVAYDADGRPLYHHPPVAPQPAPQTTPAVNLSHVSTRPETIEGHNFNPQIRSQYSNEPKIVHAARPLEPVVSEISPELRQKTELSRQKYPFLNLSDGEFVILDIKRHPIGLLAPIAVTILLLVAIFAFMAFYPSLYSVGSATIMPTPAAMLGICLLFAVLVMLGCAVALWVYLQNQFFMTNESVIQEIQESLFSRREQTVSLGSIEDASFQQVGIIQTILNYGTIRLSTEGEETTYIFRFVEDPKKQISILNNAIEAFKNGRPVYKYDD